MPAAESTTSKASKDYRDRYEELTSFSLWKCPVCHQGRMLMIEILPRSPPRHITSIKDTSSWRGLFLDLDPTASHKLGRTKRREQRGQTGRPEENPGHTFHSPDRIIGQCRHRDPKKHRTHSLVPGTSDSRPRFSRQSIPIGCALGNGLVQPIFSPPSRRSSLVFSPSFSRRPKNALRYVR
jgi:hypothetical protein